jgi:hypothetical protein
MGKAPKLLKRAKSKEKFDVAVIGGGLAGVCAAIAAARRGCKVVFIHDRPVLGGNSSSEIRMHVCGATAGFNRFARESGILEEIRMENAHRNPHDRPSVWDWILWEWVTREPNITLHLNTAATQAIMRGKDTIAGVRCVQTSTEKEFAFYANFFIDCSGDGCLAADAGADFRMGREARSEFNESLAPEKADNLVLGSSLLFEAKDVGHPVKFVPPPWAKVFATDDELRFRGHNYLNKGHWWIEWGGRFNTITDNEMIRDELIKALFGVWDHIKNRGDHGADNYILDWIGNVPGKRESRRFLGDHILTQQEVQSAELFSDRVAYGGWPIDLHPPDGIYARDERPASGATVDMFSIPFGSLYSRNIRNLLFAGRNASMTHVAFGATRVQATCAVMGQAVGTAAALCKKRRCTPRQLRQKRIMELQQALLKDDAYIIAMRYSDPDDLLRGARVTASSEAQLEMLDPIERHRCDSDRAQMFMVTGPRLNTVSLLLENSLHDAVPVTVSLHEARSLTEFAGAMEIASSKVLMPGERRAWMDFKLNASVTPNCFYYVKVHKNASIFWCWSDEDLPATQRAWFSQPETKWVRGMGTYCFGLSPASRPYGGWNVVNGVARPEGQANVWISDPASPLPQRLDLVLKRPAMINTVYLTFDTDLMTKFPHAVPPECVRDYVVFCRSAGRWREIARESGNHHRRRVHRFRAVKADALRLEVSATNGAPSARVYEIRAYLEQVTTEMGSDLNY